MLKQHKALYFIVAIIAALAVGAFVLVNIYNFKTEEEVAVSSSELNQGEVSKDLSLNGVKDWQTYRNEEYGFEFKYPQDWYLNFEEPNIEVATVPRSSYAHGTGIPPHGSAWLEVIRRDVASPEGVFEEELLGEDAAAKSPILVKMVTIKKDKGLMFEIVGYFYKYDVRQDLYGAIIDHITSTFRFITAEQSFGDKKTICATDDDCVLWMCAGPLNKEYAKTLPPDLPCATYNGYEVGCIARKCTAVK